LVIGGGQNAEHDVSLETAAAIEGALSSCGFEASTITIGRDGRWRQGEEPFGESAADSMVASLPFSPEPMWSSRQSTAPWVRTGRWQRCAPSPTNPWSAPACVPERPIWTIVHDIR
jgi:hypothetical protein